MKRQLIAVAMTLMLCSMISGTPASAQNYVLNTFNNQGMQTLSGGFQQELGPFSLRLFDNADGSGAASSAFTSPVDLSAYSLGTLNVRHNPLSGHGTDYFTVELMDNFNQTLQYNVDTTRPTAPGGFGFYEDFLSLSSPTGGSVGFNDFNFDSVSQWSVLGQPGSSGPFNVSLWNIELAAPPPPITYGGIEPDAPWRDEAAERIDRIRKADMSLRVLDQHGNHLQGVQVHVRQTRQAFNFGTAVDAGTLLGGSTNSQLYRERLLDLGFNTATLENDLKWDALAGQFGPSFTIERAVEAVDWLRDNGLDVRGHVLVWPGTENMPDYLDSLIAQAQSGDLDAQNQLRQEILAHIAEVAGATAGKVIDWDVVNEIGTNNDMLNIYGQAIMDEWFAAARSADPDAALFINEFNIISDQQRSKRQSYLDQVLGLVTRGAAIDGVGMQGHFSADSLTDIGPGGDPQSVWDVLDQFHDATGLPITITEYDLNTTNEQLKADYLRDFLTAVFAHEGVDGFVMWGFWEGRHWRPDAAMINQNWTETPMAEVWRQLVLKEWMTNEALLSDEQGLAELRAFLGEYAIEVEYGGELYRFDVVLDGDGQFDLTLPVALPEPGAAVMLSGLLFLRRGRRDAASSARPA